MARLKKTVTKEYTGLNRGGKSDEPAGGENADGGSSGAAAEPMDLMAALKARIKTRFKVLHPDEGNE